MSTSLHPTRRWNQTNKHVHLRIVEMYVLFLQGTCTAEDAVAQALTSTFTLEEHAESKYLSMQTREAFQVYDVV